MNNIRLTECIVYLEQSIKYEVQQYDLLVDFRTVEDLNVFRNATELNRNIDEQSSMVYFKNVRTQKRLPAHCYYKLNLELLLQFPFETVDGFVSRTYDMSRMSLPKDSAMELLQSHGPLPGFPHHPSVKPENIFWSKIFSQEVKKMVVVRDVGQANWNELWTRAEENSPWKLRVVFDIGAPTLARRVVVEDIVNAQKPNLLADKPVLILSHWDLDHIHGLRYMTEQDIQSCFSAVICVNNIKSVSQRLIFEKLRTHGSTTFYALCPAKRSKCSLELMHPLLQNESGVSLYIGETCRNINYAAIGMFVRGASQSASFTGDLLLSQANNMHQQEYDEGGLSQSHLLIAPHHGGRVNNKNRIYNYSITQVAISVGPNSYGHPDSSILRFYKSHSIRPVDRTDVSSDLCYSL